MSEERLNLIYQIIKENNDLGATINNKRYTLNDVHNLVDKIAKKRLVRIRSLIFTIIWGR